MSDLQEMVSNATGIIMNVCLSIVLIAITSLTVGFAVGVLIAIVQQGVTSK